MERREALLLETELFLHPGGILHRVCAVALKLLDDSRNAGRNGEGREEDHESPHEALVETPGFEIAPQVMNGREKGEGRKYDIQYHVLCQQKDRV